MVRRGIGTRGRHPIGHAVAALAGRGNVTEAVALEDEISGSVDRHPVRLSLTSRADGALAMGGPWDVVSVEVDGRSLGTLAIADALRPDATNALAALAAAGTATVLVAPVEDARAAAIAAEAGCPLKAAAPSGAAVLSASAAGALSLGIPGALRLGPQSEQLGLAEASIGQAATALALCRMTATATRRSVGMSLAASALGACLAAVGLLPPWDGGLYGFTASILVAGVVSSASVVGHADRPHAGRRN